MHITLRVVALATLVFLSVQSLPAADKAVIELDDATHAKCLKILRDGMRGDEFWPAIHAAEGLTLGGYGKEVIEFLTPKLGTDKDDQHLCGLAREIVRAGDASKSQIMLDILAGENTHGHVHAAESLFKVAEIGDGNAMRKAFKQSDNVRLKLMAAAALGRNGNKKAMTYLREMLTAKDAEQFRIAVWILGPLGDKSDIDLIKSNVPADAEPLTNAYVNNALANLGDADGQKKLAANLKSEDPAIRTYAATFAGPARLVNLADDLKFMLDDANADARIRAAQSLFDLAKPQPVISKPAKPKKTRS